MHHSRTAKRTAMTFVVAILGGALCGCPALFQVLTPIWGTVSLNGPVDSARVSVEAKGHTVWTGVCAEGEFSGRTLAWGDGPVRVTACGIVTGSGFLNATLSAYDPAYKQGDRIEVNVFTTLVDRYRVAHNCGYDTAVADVQRHLQLPSGRNYAEQLDHPSMNMYLDADVLLAKADEAGGLDAYLDALVYTAIPEADSRTQLNALYGEGGDGNFWADLAIAAAEAAGSSLGEQAAGALLQHFGWAAQDPNTDILDALAAQNAELQRIEDEVVALQAQLMQLEQQLESAVVDLLFESSQQPVRDAITNLDALVTRLAVNFTVEQAQSANPLDPHAFGLSMIGNNASPQNDVPHMLATIHGSVMPDPATGAPGAIGRFALSLSPGGGTSNLLDIYKTFEAYFGKILAYQYRGLGLITESINVLQPQDNALVQYNNADTYRHGVFTPHIESEVDEFLRWVDYLVLANADYTTDIARPRQFLPDCAALVYKRADFVAQQFSSKHPRGTVIRMIGEPAAIDDFWAQMDPNIVQQYTDTSGNFPLTSVYHTSYNLQSRDFYVTSRPAWAQPYIEWRYDASKKDFLNGRSTPQVSVAKFVLLPGAEPLPTVPEVPSDWQNCWGLAGNTGFFDQYVHVPGDIHDLTEYFIFGPSADGLSYAYEQVDGPGDGTIPYGFHLFAARHEPSVKSFADSGLKSSLSPSKNNSVTGSVDLNSLTITSRTSIGNVNVTSHNHYDPSGYAWTTYDYKVSHDASRLLTMNFTLQQAPSERWQILTSGKVKSRFTGTSWNIRTSASMSVGAGHSVATQHTPKDDYSTTPGSYALPCDPQSAAHTLQLGTDVGGGVNETRNNGDKPPTYKVDATHQFTGLVFRLAAQ